MENIAASFKALADVTRLRLLNLLAGGELCVGDLVAALGLPQSTVSRHLAVLKNAGWVRARRGGVWMHYRLHDEDALHSRLLALATAALHATDQGREDARSLGRALSGRAARA